MPLSLSSRRRLALFLGPRATSQTMMPFGSTSLPANGNSANRAVVSRCYRDRDPSVHVEVRGALQLRRTIVRACFPPRAQLARKGEIIPFQSSVSAQAIAVTGE